MKIYVVRHGQTELNKKGIFNGQIDEGLSSEGIEQAKKAKSLLPSNIKHIYSSSLKRTRETAEILNSELNIPISFHDELREVNAGSINGQPFEGELEIKHKSLHYDWRPHGGESVEDVKNRLLKILDEIRLNKKEGEILIVAHGGIIRLLHFLGDGTMLDTIGNASIQIFDLDKILDNNSI